MADIARRLNISRATVSYVLNERESELISEATRERVLAMAREMGYRPNRAAQSLAGLPSHMIELFVHGYYPAFYARALYEFEQQVGPTPYELHIVDPSHWTEGDWEKVDSGWPVDGVLIFDAALPGKAIASLKERRVPTVAIGITPATYLDHVRVDVSAALQEALRYLTARGRRVAFLSPYPADHVGARVDLRYVAYHAVMEEANLTEEVIETPERGGTKTRSAAREIMRDYVTKNGCPDAIFCFNDERAVATLAALRDLKLRVPQDVLLMGFDGIEETDYHAPPLSTIEYPIAETARLAWEFLQRRINEPDAPLQSATLEARLVLRESSER